MVFKIPMYCIVKAGKNLEYPTVKRRKVVMKSGHQTNTNLELYKPWPY